MKITFKAFLTAPVSCLKQKSDYNGRFNSLYLPASVGVLRSSLTTKALSSLLPAHNKVSAQSLRRCDSRDCIKGKWARVGPRVRQCKDALL